MHRTVALALLVATGCVAGPPPSGRSQDAVIPLEPYFRDLRMVHVTLGGSGDTLALLFDTGGGATHITPDVASRMGCTPFGRDVGHRMTGERIEFQRCDSLTVSRGSWTRRFAPVAVYDVNALLPKELPHLDGVLSLDAFRGEVVTIDLAGDRIIVRGTSADSAARDALPVRIATGETGGSYTAYVPVAARRDTLWFLVDSGDLVGTMIDSGVRRDSLLEAHDDSTIDLVVGGRAPFRSRVQFMSLIYDGVLGVDWLRGGSVTLDLRRR